MTGMKMRFARVIKRNGQYIRETEDVDYKDFKSSYRGWEFNLKTKKMCIRDRNLLDAVKIFTENEKTRKNENKVFKEFEKENTTYGKE